MEALAEIVFLWSGALGFPSWKTLRRILPLASEQVGGEECALETFYVWFSERKVNMESGK